jgi:membrane protein
MAAGMAFFLLFSIFPALLFLVTLLPYLPVDAPVDRFLVLAQPVVPTEVHVLLSEHILGLTSQPRTGLLTASAAVALFSASRAMVSLSRALNRSYRVPRLRSELLRRLRSMLLTASALLAIVVAVVGLSIGDELVGWVAGRGWLPLDSAVVILAVRWPALLVLSSFLVQQLYYLLPDVRPRWRPISTGSVLAVLGWVAATWGFSHFAARFLKFNVTYGALGSVAVVMAWMYLGAMALMLGGQVNALVQRGLPHGAHVPGDPP